MSNYRTPLEVIEDGEAAQVRNLDMEQRSTYEEAISCGATHRDAMEAAHTFGYTR